MVQDGFWNWGSDRSGQGTPEDPALKTTTRKQAAISRRSFLRLVGGAAVTSFTGCVAPFGLRKCEIAKNLPFPDLVAHLNRNIDQIDSWNCNYVTVKAHGAAMLAPSLAASMAVERPRNFRLQGTILSSNVVDLGSNDERFWVWVKNDEDPMILTARHDCLRAAQEQLPLPFEPDWLIEALGVIPLDEHEIEYEKSPSDPKKCFFRRQRKAPDGTPVELVSTVDTCLGVIVDHSLSDRAGNMIALAKMGEHEHDGRTGIVLPHMVKLSWPQLGLALSLKMGAIEVNPKTLSAKRFAMPEIANCPVHDIGGETRQATDTGRSKV
jgi:hypothetical protein